MARYCKRFYCDEQGDRICCATCWYLRDCAHPCLNHPARCGLEDKNYTKPKRRGCRSRLRRKG